MPINKDELFTEKVSGSSRTYFLDVKKTSKELLYLTISESKEDKEGKFDRDRVMVFEEDIYKFNNAFRKVMEFIRDFNDNKPAEDDGSTCEGFRKKK